MDTKLKVVDIEDKDGQVLAAYQALALCEEDLIAAQKAVDEASGYMHAVFWNVNTLLSGLVSKSK